MGADKPRWRDEIHDGEIGLEVTRALPAREIWCHRAEPHTGHVKRVEMWDGATAEQRCPGTTPLEAAVLAVNLDGFDYADSGWEIADVRNVIAAIDRYRATGEIE